MLIINNVISIPDATWMTGSCNYAQCYFPYADVQRVANNDSDHTDDDRDHQKDIYGRKGAPMFIMPVVYIGTFLGWGR